MNVVRVVMDIKRRWWCVCWYPKPMARDSKQIRTFATLTADLLALDEWLRGQQVEQMAMESTGVYWHPIWNLLEEGRQIL